MSDSGSDIDEGNEMPNRQSKESPSENQMETNGIATGMADKSTVSGQGQTG